MTYTRGVNRSNKSSSEAAVLESLNKALMQAVA